MTDDDRFPDLGEEWSCEQAQVEGADRCPFHLSSDHPAKNPSQIGKRLRGLLSQSDETGEESSPNRILGAELDALDLSFQGIQGDRRRPIDLREATIDGDVNCTAARLGPTLRLEGSEIGGNVVFDRGVAEGDIRLNDAEVGGTIDARRADIRGRLGLDGVECDGRCILLQARVRHGVHLRKSTLAGGVWHGLETEGDVQCGKARIRGPLNAERSVVGGDLIFNNAMLDHSLRLSGVTVDGAVSMNDAQVRGALSLSEAELGGDLDIRTTRFYGKVDMRDVSVEDASFSSAGFTDAFRADRATFRTLTVSSTRFEESASMSEARIVADASITGASIDGTLHLDRSRVKGKVRISDVTPAGGSAVLDFTEADIRGGLIDSSESEGMTFDFTRATLGNVRFQPEQDGSGDIRWDTENGEPFDAYRLLRTTFDGFDFTDYDTALERIDWRLPAEAEDEPVGRHGITSPSVADHEKTYTKAKRGASDEGASRAAGAFLVRELENRRKGHFEQWREALPLSDAWVHGMYRWLANWLLRLTAGYGERLAPVLGTTAAIVGLFAVAYALLLPAPPYDAGALGYVLLSLVAFVTLVLGEVSVGGGFVVQLLAQIEGFFGAFLIALFVFVFTRSVHR